MSGPKSFSPPPNYSMEVFDGKLNILFKYQRDLKTLVNEIQNMVISDTTLNIYFDCAKEFNKVSNEVAICDKTINFSYKGKFGQEIYNKIDNEIKLMIQKLENIINVCGGIKSDFEMKKNDYQTYLSYITFHQNSKSSFDIFRSEVIRSLKANVESDFPELVNEAERKISLVNFDIHKSSFGLKFSSTYDSEKQLIINHVIELERRINKIRGEVNDKVINVLRGSGQGNYLASQQRPPDSMELKSLTAKIVELINSLENKPDREKYLMELKKLQENEGTKEIFFFKELHDSILQAEETQIYKKLIKMILIELGTNRFHELTMETRQFLCNLCQKKLNDLSVKQSEMEYIRLEYENLISKSEKYFEDDELKQREHLFLKSQIILRLQNLGYEVVEDLEVIDFEREIEYLLKIPGQSNYLNLIFKNDGSFRYRFEVQENREKLSVDQIEAKLEEMKVTCSEFKQVLEELGFMGLKIQLNIEKPVNSDSLISISENEKVKINRNSAIKGEGMNRKTKYLEG